MNRHADFEFDRGCEALGHNRLALAERWFTRAIRRWPEWHEPLQRRAFVRKLMGRLKGAADDYRASLARTPLCLWCLEDAADVAMKRGRRKQAEGYLDRAIRMDPSNSSFRYDRAGVRLSLGRLTEAIEDFSRVATFSRDGRTLIALVGRARARALQGELDSALEDLDRAVKMCAGVGETHFYRGLVRFLSKDIEGAMKDLAAAKAPRGLIHQFKRPSVPGLRRAKELLMRDIPYKSGPV